MRTGDHLPSGNSGAGKSKNLLPGLCSILGTVILAGVILAFLPLTAPRLLGYGIYEVVSGSMEPEIPVGSVIYVKAADPEEIGEGEIIAFWRNDSVITHRVLENHHPEKEFITKGDANAGEDLAPIPYHDLIGKVGFHLPVLGSMMTLLASTAGKLYAAFFAVCGLLFYLLGGYMRTLEERNNGRE